MAQFFRPTHDSSEDSDGALCLEELNSPEHLAPLRPHSDDPDGNLRPEAHDVNHYLIDRPTLPVHPSLIPVIKYDLRAIPPGELPVAVVQDILRSVPIQDWEDNTDLFDKLSLEQYSCDEIDMWLQAVDPDTGDSLVHAIVRSGRLGALGACQEPAITCAYRGAIPPQKGRRAKYMLLMHQNHEGDNGLHVAARMGSLPMVKGLLRMINECFIEAGVEDNLGQFDRPKLEDVVDWSIFGSPKRIFFIEAMNSSGRDTIQEARYYGREEIAVFLEYILDQSYPPDCVDKASLRQAWRLVVDHSYRFRTSQEGL